MKDLLNLPKLMDWGDDIICLESVKDVNVGQKLADHKGKDYYFCEFTSKFSKDKEYSYLDVHQLVDVLNYINVLNPKFVEFGNEERRFKNPTTYKEITRRFLSKIFSCCSRKNHRCKYMTVETDKCE